MGLKHRLKGIAREAYARLVWHTGLHRLIDRASEPRLLILYGHCVDAPATNASLDADMRIRPERLAEILRVLGRRYELVTVGEGVARLDGGAPAGSMVALSMDDGYRDNLLDLVPLLEEIDGRATVFLEGGAVARRELPWLHALRWLDRRHGADGLARRLAERVPSARDALEGIPAGGSNRLKRVLKYDAVPAERDRALRELLAEEGEDPVALNDELYLSVDEARRLAAHERIEVGGHTVHHPVLSRLAPEAQRDEIGGGEAVLREFFGESEPADGGADLGTSGRTFAYPYGRRWDFDASAADAARAAGYASAVTTHAGVNVRSTDRYRLYRWPIHDGTRLHLVAAEASGAFELLRRFGVDLVE
ncbi:MAG: polysaccharide deacetylase family protein [Planctomycetota bacterium]